MSRSPITTWGKEAIPPHDAVFPDQVRVRLGAHADSKVISALAGYTQTSDTECFIYESVPFGNLRVTNSASGCKLKGSFRNWAAATGIVPFEQPFGCAEVERTYRALEERLGLPHASIDEGTVCHLEYAADLVMPRSPSLYIEAIQDPYRTTPYTFGYTTVGQKGDNNELRAYDKGAEREAKRNRTSIAGEAPHILRIEDRRGDVPRYFGRAIYAADLYDEGFRSELAERWEKRARSLVLRRTRVPVAHPETMSRLRERYALLGIEAEGGLDTAVLLVRTAKEAGAISRNQRDEQLKWLRKITRDAELTRSSDLAGELDHAIRHVMGS